MWAVPIDWCIQLGHFMSATSLGTQATGSDVHGGCEGFDGVGVDSDVELQCRQTRCGMQSLRLTPAVLIGKTHHTQLQSCGCPGRSAESLSRKRGWPRPPSLFDQCCPLGKDIPETTDPTGRQYMYSHSVCTLLPPRAQGTQWRGVAAH
jgi:hypothetical protein